jgi:hypothetical protein
MYRIAQQISPSQRIKAPGSVPSHKKLQSSISQSGINLPDRLRCCYPDTGGRLVAHDIVVHALGDNAHGVCFLVGVSLSSNVANIADAADALKAIPIAFRLDRIDGPVTRIDGGESLSIHMWERLVRQRFANDRDTDALPLSSILITDGARGGARAFVAPLETEPPG